MNTFLITLLVVGIVIAGMAIGVMFGRKPIAGSCGGLGGHGTGLRIRLQEAVLEAPGAHRRPER